MNDNIVTQKFDIQDVSTSIQSKAADTIAKLSNLQSVDDIDNEMKQFKDFVSDVSNGNIDLSIHQGKSEYKVDFTGWPAYKQIHKQAPGKYRASDVAKNIAEVLNTSSVANEKESTTSPSVTATAVSVTSPTQDADKKLSAKDAIAMLTASIISTLGGCNPIINILSFYGHRTENIVADITGNALSYMSNNDSLTISNINGLMMNVDTTSGSINAITEKVAEAISAILVASTLNKELSMRLSKNIDIDSIKSLIDSQKDSVESTLDDSKSVVEIQEQEPSKEVVKHTEKRGPRKFYGYKSKEFYGSSRHENDYYPTPKSLVWELLKAENIDKSAKILEPCCGEHKSISNTLIELGYTDVTSKDIIFGNDFLKDDYKNEHYDVIISNPPFNLFDEFLHKAKEVADKVYFIMPNEYTSAQCRANKGLWKGLKSVHQFSRKVDYNSPYRDDGMFNSGQMTTGWYCFEPDYRGKASFDIMDVDKYIIRKSKKAEKKSQKVA